MISDFERYDTGNEEEKGERVAWEKAGMRDEVKGR